ncbi:HD-GYP domain-containing protein [Aeromonas caviae]|uniref:HD-GYP domain-containing protein n=1 Tax=Aeromonas caviae TaxID=648 RepID=UPI001F4DD4E7|nr:HD domain-containing phosphohydrolase [Aeromonas caviae]
MAAYARALADAAGWSPEQSDLLELAAPMHDMGKIGIPDHILKKPGPLTEEEWVIMRSHPRIGYEILRRSDAPIFRMAAEIALHHHEKWDGSGYPAGETGEGIPEASRIVAIADVFDALSVRRPYKEPWPLDRVLATMRDGAGQHFDPRLLARFSRSCRRSCASRLNGMPARRGGITRWALSDRDCWPSRDRRWSWDHGPG